MVLQSPVVESLGYRRHDSIIQPAHSLSMLGGGLQSSAASCKPGSRVLQAYGVWGLGV